jgi:hypothetical protein
LPLRATSFLAPVHESGVAVARTFARSISSSPLRATVLIMSSPTNSSKRALPKSIAKNSPDAMKSVSCDTSLPSSYAFFTAGSESTCMST